MHPEWTRNKLLTPAQARELDRASIQDRGIPSLDLMERAGKLTAEGIMRLFPDKAKVLIALGRGNNAGDGLVIARHLLQAGFHVSLTFLAGTELSNEAETNLRRLKNIFPDREFGPISNPNVLIDAVFGTGFRGSLPKDVSSFFESCISIPYKIAVDCPSGLNSESGHGSDSVLDFDVTFTYGRAKTGFYFNKGPRKCGHVIPVDIGFPPELEADTYFGISEYSRPCRSIFEGQHKYENGVAHIISGSFKYRGAPLMAAKAASAYGCGAVFLHLPGCFSELTLDDHDDIILDVDDDERRYFALEDARSILEQVERRPGPVLIGPGLGDQPGTQAFIREIIEQLNQTVIIDADALLGDILEIVSKREAPTILTPHVGELRRIVPSLPEDRWDQVDELKTLCASNHLYLLSKGSPSIFVSPERQVWVSKYPSKRYAVAGFGDVLGGAICAAAAEKIDAGSAVLNGISWLNQRYHQARTFRSMVRPTDVIH